MTTTTTTRRPGRRLATSACTALLALTLSSGPAHGQDASEAELEQTIDPDQAVVDEPAVLDRGHVDLGPRYIDGEWTLLIHDDAAHDEDGATSVWRHPDRAVLQVGDASLLTVPEGDGYAFLGVPGGEDVHVIPQTQDPEVVWLGWNTQDPEVMATIDRGVTLSLIDVEGPGDLVVFLQSGSFDEPDVLWDSREADPGSAWVDVNTHTHANWVFSEPGVHLVHLRIGADLLDGSTVEDTAVIRFAVGGEASTDDALAATPTGGEAADGAAETEPAPVVAEPEGSGAPVAATIIAAITVALLVAGTSIAVRGRRAKRLALTGRESR